MTGNVSGIIPQSIYTIPNPGWHGLRISKARMEKCLSESLFFGEEGGVERIIGSSSNGTIQTPLAFLHFSGVGNIPICDFVSIQ
jgi:hypothetical protein